MAIYIRLAISLEMRVAAAAVLVALFLILIFSKHLKYMIIGLGILMA